MPRKRANLAAETTPSVPLSWAEVLDRPNKLLPPEQFFLITSQYQPREGTAYYLYRSWPVIDRKQGPNGPGAKLYIDKVAEPFDQDWLLKRWGSGDYKVCFTDSAKPRGQTQITYTTLKLRDDAFAPVLDQSELVIGDPKNSGYIEGLRARGLWQPEGDGEGEMSKELVGLVRDMVQQPHANQRGNPAEGAAIDMLKGTLEWALKASDPFAAMEKLAPLLQQGGSTAEILKVMLEQQARTQELMLKVVESVRPAPAAAPQSLTNSLEEVLKLDQVLSRLGRRGNPSSGGSSWVSDLMSQAPMLLMLISQAAAAFRAPGQAPPVPPAPAALPPAPAHPGKVVEMPKPPEASAGPLDGTAAPAAADPGSLQAIAGQVLNAMQRGFSGDDFATALSLQFGDEVYQQIRALGAESVLLLLKSDPAVWAQFAPVEQQLSGFLAEFMAYGDEPQEEAA
jgi:hypothetical protein